MLFDTLKPMIRLVTQFWFNFNIKLDQFCGSYGGSFFFFSEYNTQYGKYSM